MYAYLLKYLVAACLSMQLQIQVLIDYLELCSWYYIRVMSNQYCIRPFSGGATIFQGIAPWHTPLWQLLKPLAKHSLTVAWFLKLR